MDRNTHSRFFGMLGFAMKAGRIAMGTDTVIASMKAGGSKRAKLVLVSSNASEGTKKRLGFKAEYYEIPFRIIEATSDVLGDALGRSYAPVALAILDEGFALEILKALKPTEKTETPEQRKEVPKRNR